MSRKIVILDAKGMNPGDLSWDSMNALGEVKIHDTTPYEEIVDKTKGFEIAIINKCRFDENILSKLPDLKYVCVSATGYDNVDVEFAKSKGVLVSNVQGYSTMSVVQHVFSLIFALTHKAEYYTEEVLKGRWTKNDFFTFWDFPIVGLEDKTLGLYGFGKIASKVAEVANAFGMNIIANRKHPEKGYPYFVNHVELGDLLSRSDILSLHAPLTKENEYLINSDTLKLMKSTAILINTARGQMINEKDLSEALNKSQIKAAGVDVLSTEPPNKDNPLLKSKNCVITPHHAWASVQARRVLLNGVIENVKSFIDNSPQNIVN